MAVQEDKYAYDFQVRDEFRDLLPPAEEWRTDALLADLRKYGVLDPLKVWEEENVLLDGHRRLDLITTHTEILDQFDMPAVTYLSFSSADEAKAWMIGYQNCRRSVSKVAMAVTEGLKVEKEKPGPKIGNTDVTNSAMPASEKMDRTRNKQAAEGWKEVAKADPEAAQTILSDEDTPVTKKDLRSIATAPEEARPAKVQEVAAKATGKPHVTNNSGEEEWYTPSRIIDVARQVLGSITLDPATSEKAQETVGAERYFTKDVDGLTQDWYAGTIWMNPPYGKRIIEDFIDKFLHEWTEGHFQAGCVLVNNGTETAWFQRLASQAEAVCFIRGRVKFLDATGTPANTPLQGQALLYFGDYPDKFYRAAEVLGTVMEVRCDD